METLVVVAQHRNTQYYSGTHSPTSPSKAFFREVNCRSFHEQGILPNPFDFSSPPLTEKKHRFSPKTPPMFIKSEEQEEEPKSLKTKGKSNSVPINFNKFRSLTLNDEFAFSELWAGPTYCNSPPPSSLPIPKFSLRQKRSVSLDLPVSSAASGLSLPAVARSAPPSPGRQPYPSLMASVLSAASATKDLRRILHLDINED